MPSGAAALTEMGCLCRMDWPEKQGDYSLFRDCCQSITAGMKFTTRSTVIRRQKSIELLTNLIEL